MAVNILEEDNMLAQAATFSFFGPIELKDWEGSLDSMCGGN